MRIVSVCPSNTEIACALGLQDDLVALDDDSDHPPEVQHLPRVGLDLQIDADKVRDLEPELVLASLSVPGMEKVVAELEARRLPVVVLNAKRWAEILDDIRLVGRRTGRPDEAEDVVGAMLERREAVESRTRGTRRVPFYFEWWPKPLIVPTRDSWINDIAEAGGGVHVFGELAGESKPIEDRAVFERAFEHVFLCWCGTLQRKQSADRIASRPGWESLPAVRAGKVHLLDEGVYGRPGPRVVEGMEEFARLLHGC